MNIIGHLAQKIKSKLQAREKKKALKSSFVKYAPKIESEAELKKVIKNFIKRTQSEDGPQELRILQSNFKGVRVFKSEEGKVLVEPFFENFSKF